jgi:predicted RNA-binding protein
MCQATVYLAEEGQEEEVMRDVMRLVPVEGGVQAEKLFEEPVFLAASIAEVDFLRSKVRLVAVPDGARRRDAQRSGETAGSATPLA